MPTTKPGRRGPSRARPATGGAGTGGPAPFDQHAFQARLAEARFAERVGNRLALFEATGDARFFWQAVAAHHEASKPLPSELTAQLAAWAAQVQTLSDPQAICRALQLTGGEKQHIGPKQSAGYVRRWKVAREVLWTLDHFQPCTLAGAMRLVATSRGMTFDQVKKCYHSVTGGRPSHKGAEDAAASLIAKVWR